MFRLSVQTETRSTWCSRPAAFEAASLSRSSPRRFILSSFPSASNRKHRNQRCSLLQRASLPSSLPHRVFDFAQPVGPFQHFARFWPIRRAHDSVALHQIDEVSCASVADAQASLKQGSGCLPIFEHDSHGVLKKLVMLIVCSAVPIRTRVAVPVFARGLQEVLLVLGGTLRFPEFNHRSNLFFSDERSVHAMDAR